MPRRNEKEAIELVLDLQKTTQLCTLVEKKSFLYEYSNKKC